MMKAGTLGLLICLVATVSQAALTGSRLQLVRPAEYSGMCDASASVAVNSNLFLVASDEDNTLRVYQRHKGGPPVAEFPMSGFLRVTKKSPEADLEAAARIGDRVFWIGSHGRNREAKERSNRCRFFATDLKLGGGGLVSLVPAGQPYTLLLEDLTRDPKLSRFELDIADQRAPKDEEALNIEGLSATPEGHLLIGFRNPIPQGKALIVPFLNPNEAVAGQRARLGDPIQLDLGGLGIRDMALWQDTYVIIAGPYGSRGKFSMYRWAGGNTPPEKLKVDGLNRYHPEALIIYPDAGLNEFQVLSDDGERLIDGIPGKQIKDPTRQRFRSFWLTREE